MRIHAPRSWSAVVVCATVLTCGTAFAQTAKRGSSRPATKKPDGQEERFESQIRELAGTVGRLEQLVLQQNRELEAQRAMIREQQERLGRLEQEVEQKAANQAPAPPPAAREPQHDDVKVLEGQVGAMADNQKELGERVNKLQTDMAATSRANESKLRQLGNFSFSGDFRYRYEPFFGGPSNGSLERQRQRFRLRFNANAKFNDEISGGLTLASGDLNDPISTNQTLTSILTRKPIELDKAFLQYNPKWFKPLTLTGGKFAYTWYRTELTLDNDLNPEGISESLNFEFKTPVFQRLVLVGFQVPVNEVAGRGNADSLLYGGQVQTYWRLHDRVKFAGHLAFYNWHQADAVASALNTNAVFGNLLRLGGAIVQNSRTTAAPFQFASKFAMLDVIGRLDVNTGHARWPLLVQLDFVNNTRPCANLSALAPGATLTAPCNPRDRSGYWADVRVGRLQEQGDWTLGYSFIHIEREAVLGAFNFSDLRQNSNVRNNRIEIFYQANRNVQFGFTGLFGRPLVTSSSPTKEDILKRLQIDVVYKF